ncbi:MAG TPA: hypothetical protein VMK31_03810 [Sphingomicrobium sp.]|nr:hypothetical protein [Sphingomicrobium sp.]
MTSNLISESYLSEQRGLHRNPRYGVASLEFAPVVRQLLIVGRCSSLSDYGAGKCNLFHALGGAAAGIDYYPYDPVFPDYGAARPADLVTCIDVLEHVEPDCLDAVLDELASITSRLALLTVHTGPAKKVLTDGRNAHLTQQSAQWWTGHLERRFDILHLKPIPKGFFVVVAPKGSAAALARTADLAALAQVVDSARPRSFWGRLGKRVLQRSAQRSRRPAAAA